MLLVYFTYFSIFVSNYQIYENSQIMNRKILIFCIFFQNIFCSFVVKLWKLEKIANLKNKNLQSRKKIIFLLFG